ncbi:MAG: threonine-phosphate decarboxylase [Streptosporangiales bacterium]|nr:threonine-phosphate decarboxylase [Streptosporangiales bacterium]
MHTITDVDLGHHGDVEIAPGLVDLAVNVRPGAPPRWLAERLRAALDAVASYPDPAAARTAVARRHGRPSDDVLLTAGGAEAFVLLARALRPQRAAVVHPQFTEPEAALRASGHPVDRVVLAAEDGFRLAAEAVPEDADLVVVGNPTNPTSVLHPTRTLAALARPGRVLVVDEAFADCLPGERGSLAGRRDLPGLVVVRSLTKTWGLAGLRVGYLLAAPELVARLAEAQPLWPVSTPALVAVQACCGQGALAEAEAWARQLGEERTHLSESLAALGGVHVVPNARASFLLLRVPDGQHVRGALRDLGFAVRRGDTFPGLGPDWMRVAVRDRSTSDAFTAALARVLGAA